MSFQVLTRVCLRLVLPLVIAAALLLAYLISTLQPMGPYRGGVLPRPHPGSYSLALTRDERVLTVHRLTSADASYFSSLPYTGRRFFNGDPIPGDKIVFSLGSLVHFEQGAAVRTSGMPITWFRYDRVSVDWVACLVTAVLVMLALPLCLRSGRRAYLWWLTPFSGSICRRSHVVGFAVVVEPDEKRQPASSESP
jgi:hypothetical protein